MRTSVIIPTYIRPSALETCVRSILALRQVPDEIVIAGRTGDAPTEAKARELAASSDRVEVRSVWVSAPGHIPPVQAGARAAGGDIVAIVDDDVTVPPDWLGRLTAHFGRDSRVAVVGGRVMVSGQEMPRLKGRPGRISWYGRHWANLGSVGGEAPFDVAGLVECNWAWRRSLLVSLDNDLEVNYGDAILYGLDWCLQVRRRGYRVLYDPLAVVHHRLVARAPELSRADRPSRTFGYCRNYTYIMVKHLPRWQKATFLAWWFLIGERTGWGLATVIADAIIHRRFDWAGEVRPALQGKIDGLRRGFGRTKIGQ